MSVEPTQRQRTEHGWLLQLRTSQAFAYYLSEVEKRAKLAMREVCAEDPKGTREFHAGRLSALTEAAALVEKKYKELKPLVEVVEL